MVRAQSLKIVFVEPPSPWLVRPRAQAALGPLYLATVLNEAGHPTGIFHPTQPSSCECLSDAHVVAFSGTTLEYPEVARYAKWIKKHLPDMTIWYGGPHATASSDRIPDWCDSLGIGEGENYIARMADEYLAGESKRRYSSDETFEDLDCIPFPDRRLICGEHGGDIFSFGETYTESGGSENVITSRGCIHSCAFCASNNMWKHKIRFRSVPNVVEEVARIVETTGCRQIRFADDHFVASRSRAMALCDGLRPLGVAWRCSVRADSLTEEVCQAMAAAGCKEISPGIESGDQRVLDGLNKRTDLNAVVAGCRAATDAGIKVRALFMIGTPCENYDTPELNRDFMSRLSYHSITLSTFIPLPGTPVWANPQAFDCEILSRDFRQYNKDFWIAGADGKQKRAYVALIRNHRLTTFQQADNVVRMERYVEDTGKRNLG